MNSLVYKIDGNLKETLQVAVETENEMGITPSAIVCNGKGYSYDSDDAMLVIGLQMTEANYYAKHSIDE
ncbi:MAG TPA: hypothetical protein VK152_00315 [Paludibacter sp.]|nr:hypothetical protein [Paludibacter sp.]